MKRTVIALLATTLLGSLACGPAAQAQEKQKPEAKTNAPAARMPPARRDYTDFYAQTLKLNDEQKQKARPIFEEETKSLMALRQEMRDKKITQDEYRKKSLEIRESTTAKLKPVLTDEQWQKFSKMRGGGMRPTPPGTPPPQKPATPAK